nr:hypothetical protein [Klebsiella pneumoniae]
MTETVGQVPVSFPTKDVAAGSAFTRPCGACLVGFQLCGLSVVCGLCRASIVAGLLRAGCKVR